MNSDEFPIQIDKRSGIPVYVQFGEQIRLHIKRGFLKVGDALPTVRSLAVELGINANTVARVFRDLQTEGVLRLERGVGTFVAETADLPVEKKAFNELEKKVQEVIRIAEKVNMTPNELTQLIEIRWKEETHDQRNP